MSSNTINVLDVDIFLISNVAESVHKTAASSLSPRITKLKKKTFDASYHQCKTRY